MAELAEMVDRELAKVPADPYTAASKQEAAPEEHHSYYYLTRLHDRYGSNLKQHVQLNAQRRRIRLKLQPVCHECHRAYPLSSYRAQRGPLCPACGEVNHG